MDKLKKHSIYSTTACMRKINSMLRFKKDEPSINEGRPFFMPNTSTGQEIGPGKYEVRNICFPKADEPSISEASQKKNIFSSNFKSNTQRFLHHLSASPLPGSYNSIHYTISYEACERKKIGKKGIFFTNFPKYHQISKEDHPGPGKYDICREQSPMRRYQQNSQSVFASTTTRHFIHCNCIPPIGSYNIVGNTIKEENIRKLKRYASIHSQIKSSGNDIAFNSRSERFGFATKPLYSLQLIQFKPAKRPISRKLNSDIKA